MLSRKRVKSGRGEAFLPTSVKKVQLQYRFRSSLSLSQEKDQSKKVPVHAHSSFVLYSSSLKGQDQE